MLLARMYSPHRQDTRQMATSGFAKEKTYVMKISGGVLSGHYFSTSAKDLTHNAYCNGQ